MGAAPDAPFLTYAGGPLAGKHRGPPTTHPDLTDPRRHQAVFAVGALAATGHQVPLLQLGLALAISGVTHYVADRRVPLRRLADALRKSPAWLDNVGGMYALDQSWHIGFIFLAALMVT